MTCRWWGLLIWGAAHRPCSSSIYLLRLEFNWRQGCSNVSIFWPRWIKKNRQAWFGLEARRPTNNCCSHKDTKTKTLSFRFPFIPRKKKTREEVQHDLLEKLRQDARNQLEQQVVVVSFSSIVPYATQPSVFVGHILRRRFWAWQGPLPHRGFSIPEILRLPVWQQSPPFWLGSKWQSQVSCKVVQHEARGYVLRSSVFRHNSDGVSKLFRSLPLGLIVLRTITIGKPISTARWKVYYAVYSYGLTLLRPVDVRKSEPRPQWCRQDGLRRPHEQRLYLEKSAICKHVRIFPRGRSYRTKKLDPCRWHLRLL